MKNINILTPCLTVLFFIGLSLVVSGQEAEENQTPRTIEELRKEILEVLQETNTPAAGIALVNQKGPVWIEGLGMADVEKERTADEETMFRIGSTSKIFVALAVLKLQEEGQLDLKDRVRELAPEIEFTNRWEDTHPILVEHLLEHTTGWDDMHPVEFAHNDPNPIPLKEGLDYHPHSRTSRWVPGTRMAYANSGPAVAAYLVEKISGQSYEDYIRENFFTPMGMETMTYFLSEDYKEKGATLYREGYPQDYWHILTRPSGAVNASPRDMAKVVQFFINRGKIDTIQLISEGSLKRMETPSTTLGAKAGLKYGYGLCLYTSEHNGFIYYKHGGGIRGGISDFSYLPAYGLGYSVQINAGNPDAIRKISRLIRNYQTRDLSKAEVVDPLHPPVSHSFNGYYHPINPRNNKPYYLPPLVVERIWTEGDTLFSQLPAHVGKVEKFIPVSTHLYRSLERNRTEVAVVRDPLRGEVLELVGKESGTVTVGSVPGVWVFGRIIVLILWILLLMRAFLLFPFWAYRFWKGKIPGGAPAQVRFWPVLAGGFLLSSAVFFMMGAMGGVEYFAKPGIISIPIMLGTIAFFAAAVYSVVTVIRFRNHGLKRSVYIPAALHSVVQFLVAFFLLWHGVIGVRMWV